MILIELDSPLTNESFLKAFVTRKLFQTRGIQLCALILVLALQCGCQSARVKESDRAATVVITNHLPAEIKAATTNVFGKHGYDPGRAEARELVFERPAGMLSSVVSGDWFAGQVWRRVLVHQRELDTTRILLECDVYLVQEPEDPFFEKKRKLRGRDRECQQLLEQIAAEVQPQPARPSTPDMPR